MKLLAVKKAIDTKNKNNLPADWPVDTREIQEEDRDTIKAPWVVMTEEEFDKSKDDLHGQYEAWKSQDQKKYRLKNYRFHRENACPQIRDQLDMIWHELDETGTLSKGNEWFLACKSVKERFPKPNA